MGSQRTPILTGKQAFGTRYGMSNTSVQLTPQHKENVAVLHEEWDKVKIDYKKDKNPGVTMYSEVEPNQSIKDFQPFNMKDFTDRYRKQKNNPS